MAAVLGALARDLTGTDQAALERMGTVPVLGAGQPVGQVRPVLPADLSAR